MNQYYYSYGPTEIFSKNECIVDTQLLPNQLLIKILYVGVCGTDLFHHKNHNGKTLFLGHEWIGEIIGVGEGISNFIISDWVTSPATLGCDECNFCKINESNFCEKPIHFGSDQFGALRSHLILNANQTLKLKTKHISETLIEVVAVAEEALNLVSEHASITNIQRALVLGGGSVGILCAFLLSKKNINVHLVDVSLERIHRAQKFKIKSSLLKQELLFGDKNCYQLVIDATNDRNQNISPGFNYINLFLAKKSLALIIGKYSRPIQVDLNSFALQGSKIVFMRGVPSSTLKNCVENWSGKLGEIYTSLVTHEFSSKKLDEAYSIAHSVNISGKVIIKME